MTQPHYDDNRTVVYLDDCLTVLRALPDASMDAVITDPPYGLSNTDPRHVREALERWLAGDREFLPAVGGGGFMGKAWDSFVPPAAVWDECYRVLKPGGHLLSFAGSRTFDLMTLAIRLAGFDIRDSLAWLYGSGFPKSMDVSKAIDKAAGAEREVVSSVVKGKRLVPGADAAKNGKAWHADGRPDYVEHETRPATPDAEKWQGWGTALKPAFEPIVVARKPIEGTVAANVLAQGVGALNIDATRIATTDKWSASGVRSAAGTAYTGSVDGSLNVSVSSTHEMGRWPANVVLDESQAAALDEQSGVSKSKRSSRGAGKVASATFGEWGMAENDTRGHDDEGGASRFFYVAKAPKSERPVVDDVAHPTVKPLALMRWLIRLVTPVEGVVLEPFAGSGTTVEAAILEDKRVIAIEREADYWPLIRYRIARGNDVELP